MSVTFRIPVIFSQFLEHRTSGATLHLSTGDTEAQQSHPVSPKKAAQAKFRYLLNDIMCASVKVISVPVTINLTIDDAALRGHPAFYDYDQFTLIPVRLLAIDMVGAFALVVISTTDSSTPDAAVRSYAKVPLQLVHLDCYTTLQDDRDSRYALNLYNLSTYSPYEQEARYCIDNMLSLTSPATLASLRNRSHTDCFVNADSRITYLEHPLYKFIRGAVINAVCLLFSMRSFTAAYVHTHLQIHGVNLGLEVLDCFSELDKLPQYSKHAAPSLVSIRVLKILTMNNREALRALLSRSCELSSEESDILLAVGAQTPAFQRLLLRLCHRLPDCLEKLIADYSDFYSQAISYIIMRLCTVDDGTDESRTVQPRFAYDLNKLTLTLTNMTYLMDLDISEPIQDTNDAEGALVEGTATAQILSNSLTRVQYSDAQTSADAMHAFYMQCLRHGIVLYSRETRRIFNNLISRCARGTTTFSFYSSPIAFSTKQSFAKKRAVLLRLFRYSKSFLQSSGSFLQLLAKFCAPIRLSIDSLLNGFESSKILLQQYNALFHELDLNYSEIGYNFIQIKRKIYMVLKEESIETCSLLQRFSHYPHTINFLRDPLILPLVRRRTLKSPRIYVEKYIYQQIHLEPPHVYHALDIVSDDDDEENRPTLQHGEDGRNIATFREAKKEIMKTVLEQSSGSSYADFFYDDDLGSDQYSDTLKHALMFSKLFSIVITDLVPLIATLFFRDTCLRMSCDAEHEAKSGGDSTQAHNPVAISEIFNHELIIFLKRTFEEDLETMQTQLLQICCEDNSASVLSRTDQHLITSSIESLIMAQNVSVLKPKHTPLISLDFVCLRKPDISKPYQRGEDTHGFSNFMVGFTSDCIAQVTMLRTIVTNIIHSLHRFTLNLQTSIMSNLSFVAKSIVPGYSDLPSIKRYCRCLVQKELELIQADLTSFNILHPKTFQDRIQREVYLEDIIASRYGDFELAYFEERKNLRLQYSQLLERNFKMIAHMEDIIKKYPPSPMAARANLVIVPFNRKFFQVFDQSLSALYSLASLCADNITEELTRNRMHQKALSTVLRYQYLTAKEDAELLEQTIFDLNMHEANSSLPEAIYAPPPFIYRAYHKRVVREQHDMKNVLQDEINNFNNPMFNIRLTDGSSLASYGLCEAYESNYADSVTAKQKEESSDIVAVQGKPPEESEPSSPTATSRSQKLLSTTDFHGTEFPFLQRGKVLLERNTPENNYRNISTLYVIVDNAVALVRKIMAYIRDEIMAISPNFYVSIVVYDTQIMKRQLINKLISVIKSVREHVRQTVSEVLQVPFDVITFFESRICLDMDTPENLDRVIIGLADARRFIQTWTPAIQMLMDLLPHLSYLEGIASITDIQSLFDYLKVSSDLRNGPSDGKAPLDNANEQKEDSNSSDSESSDKKKIVNSERAAQIREEIMADFEYETRKESQEIQETLHERRVFRFLMSRDLMFVAEDKISMQQKLDHAFDTQLWSRIERDRVRYERRKEKYYRKVAANKIDPAEHPIHKIVTYRATMPKVSTLVTMRLTQLRLHGYSYKYPILAFLTRVLNLRRLITICKKNIDRRLQSFSTFIYLSVEYLLYLRQLCTGLANEVIRLNSSDIVLSVSSPHDFREKYPKMTANITLNRLEQYFRSQNDEESYAFIKFIQSHTSLPVTRYTSIQGKLISLYLRPGDEYLCKNPLVTDLESFFQFTVKCICETDEETRSGTIKGNRDNDEVLKKKNLDPKHAENTSPYFNLYIILSEVRVIAAEAIKIFKAISQWSDILGIALAIEEPSFYDIMAAVESPCQLVVSIVDMFVSYVRIMNRPVTAFNPSLFLGYIDTIFKSSRIIYTAERTKYSSSNVLLRGASKHITDCYNSEYSYHSTAAQRLVGADTAEFLINEDYNKEQQAILEMSVFAKDSENTDVAKCLTTNIDVPRHEELISEGLKSLNLPTSEREVQSNKFVEKGMQFILSLINGEKTSLGYTLLQSESSTVIPEGPVSGLRPSPAPVPASALMRASPLIPAPRVLKQELSIVQEESGNAIPTMTSSFVSAPNKEEQDNSAGCNTEDSQTQKSHILEFGDNLIEQYISSEESPRPKACDPPSEISIAPLRGRSEDISMSSFSMEHMLRGGKVSSLGGLNRALAPGGILKANASAATADFLNIIGFRLAISNSSRASSFILSNQVRDATVFTNDANTGLQSLRDIAINTNIVKTAAKVQFFSKAFVKKKDIRTTIRAKNDSADVISAKIIETINGFKHATLYEDQHLDSNFSTWLPTIKSLISTLILYSVQHFSFLSAIRFIFNSNYFVFHYLNKCMEYAKISDEPLSMSIDWQNTSSYSFISIRNVLELITPYNHRLAMQINKQYLLNYSAESKLLEIYYWLHNIELFLTHYTINLNLNDDMARLLCSIVFNPNEGQEEAKDAGTATEGEGETATKASASVEQEGAKESSAARRPLSKSLLLQNAAQFQSTSEEITEQVVDTSETAEELSDKVSDGDGASSADDEATDIFETPFGKIESYISKPDRPLSSKPVNKILAGATLHPPQSAANQDNGKDIEDTAHEVPSEPQTAASPNAREVSTKRVDFLDLPVAQQSLPLHRQPPRSKSRTFHGQSLLPRRSQVKRRESIIRKRRSYDGPTSIILPFFNTHSYVLKAIREAVCTITAILADGDIIPNVKHMARMLEEKLLVCQSFVLALLNSRKILPELISLSNAIYDGVTDLYVLRVPPNDIKRVTMEILSCLKYLCLSIRAKHEIVYGFDNVEKQDHDNDKNMYTIPFTSFLDNLNLLDRRRCGTRFAIPRFFKEEAPNPNCFRLINLLTRGNLARITAFIANVDTAEDLLARGRESLTQLPIMTTIFANQQYRICAPYVRLPLSFAIIYSQLTAATLSHVLADELFHADYSPFIAAPDAAYLSSEAQDAGAAEQDLEGDNPNKIVDSNLSYSLLVNTIGTTGHFFGLYKGHESVLYHNILKANARVKDCYLFTDGSLHSQHIIHNYRKALLLLLNERYCEVLVFCTYQAIVYALSCVLSLYCDGRPESFIYCYENIICNLMHLIETSFYELCRNIGRLKARNSFQVGSALSAMRSKVLMLKALYVRLLEHRHILDLMVITTVNYIHSLGLAHFRDMPPITSNFKASGYWDYLIQYGSSGTLMSNSAEKGCTLSVTSNKYASALAYGLGSDTLLGNGVNRRIDMPVLDHEYTQEDKLLLKTVKARLMRHTDTDELHRSSGTDPYEQSLRASVSGDVLLQDDFTTFSCGIFEKVGSLYKSSRASFVASELDDKMQYSTPITALILNCDSSTTDFRMPLTPLSETLNNMVVSGKTVELSASYFNPANEYDTVFMSYEVQRVAAQIVAAMRTRAVPFIVTDAAQGYNVPEVYFIVHLIGRIVVSHIVFMAVTEATFQTQYLRLRELLISRHVVVLYAVETLSMESICMLANLLKTEALSYGFEHSSSYIIESDVKLEFISGSQDKSTATSHGWIPIYHNGDHAFCRLLIWLSGAIPHEQPSSTAAPKTSSQQSLEVRNKLRAADHLHTYYPYQLHPASQRVVQTFSHAYCVYVPMAPYFSFLHTMQPFMPFHLTCALARLNDRSAFMANFASFREASDAICKEQLDTFIQHITMQYPQKLGPSCHMAPPFKLFLQRMNVPHGDAYYAIYSLFNQLSSDFPRFLPYDAMLIQSRLSPSPKTLEVCMQTLVYVLSYLHITAPGTSATNYEEADINAYAGEGDANTRLGALEPAGFICVPFQSRLDMLVTCITSTFGLSANDSAFLKRAVTHVTTSSLAGLIKNSSSRAFNEEIEAIHKSLDVLSEFGVYGVTVLLNLLMVKEPFAILTTTMERQFFNTFRLVLSKTSTLKFVVAHSSTDIYVHLDALSHNPGRYVLVIILDRHSDRLLYQNILGLLGSRQTVTFDNNLTYTFKSRIRIMVIARTMDARIKWLNIKKLFFSRTLHLSNIGFYKIIFGNVSCLNMDHINTIKSPGLASISSYDKIAQYIYAHFDIDFFSYTNSALTTTKLGLYISYLNFLIYSFITFMAREVSTRSTLTTRQWHVIKAILHIFLRYYGIIETHTNAHTSQEEEVQADTMNSYHEISLRSCISDTPITSKQQKELRKEAHMPLEFILQDALAPQFLLFNEDVTSPSSTDAFIGGRQHMVAAPSEPSKESQKDEFDYIRGAGSNQILIQFTQSFVSRLLLTSNSRVIADILHYSVISTVFSAFSLLYRMECTTRGRQGDYNCYKIYKALLAYIPTFSAELEGAFFNNHIFYKEGGFRLNKWMQLFYNNAVGSLQDLYASQTFFFMSIGNQPPGLDAALQANGPQAKSQVVGSPVPKRSLINSVREQSPLGIYSARLPALNNSPTTAAPAEESSQQDPGQAVSINKHGIRRLWRDGTYIFIAITSYLSDKVILSVAKKLGLTMQLITELESNFLPQHRKKCAEVFTKQADQMARGRMRHSYPRSPARTESINSAFSHGRKITWNTARKNTDGEPYDSNQKDLDGSDSLSSSKQVVSAVKSTGNRIPNPSRLQCQPPATKQLSAEREIEIAPIQSSSLKPADTALMPPAKETPKGKIRAKLNKLKSLQLTPAPQKEELHDNQKIVAFIRRYIPIMEVPYKIGEEVFISNNIFDIQSNYADTSNMLQLVVTSDISAYAVYYAGCMLSGTSFAILSDACSGKTTALQLAVSLLGSNHAALQTFQVGTSSIRTIEDLYVEILLRGYFIRPETSRCGNVYSARSVTGKFTILHITGLTAENMLDFLSPQLLERIIYIDSSQRAISRAIGGFCGHIFLNDSAIVYEVSSSNIAKIFSILQSMSINASVYTATAKPTFLHSLIYRNFVHEYLIQDSYHNLGSSMVAPQSLHYDIDDPFTAMTQQPTDFYASKLLQPGTARTLAEKGVKRFPRLSAEAITSNIAAMNSSVCPQLQKYSPMSVIIRTLVRSFTEGLLMIKDLLPISILELLSAMKRHTYFDDTDTRDVFGYPPLDFLENLHLLVPSANILFSALLRHGSISAKVSVAVYEELINAFSTGMLASTSVFSVLVPECAASFKRMYPFLVPFSYGTGAASDTINLALHFSWEQCLKTVIDVDLPIAADTSQESTNSKVVQETLDSRTNRSTKPPPDAFSLPMVIFSGDYSTRHRYELQRQISIAARKNFRCNKVLTINGTSMFTALRFTRDIIDELQADPEESDRRATPSNTDKTQGGSEAQNQGKAKPKRTMNLNMLGKLPVQRDVHLTSLLTRQTLDFSDSESETYSDYSYSSTDKRSSTDHEASDEVRLSETKSESTQRADPAKPAITDPGMMFLDYAQGFTRQYTAQEGCKETPINEEAVQPHVSARAPEKKYPSTTIVRLMSKYKQCREVLRLSGNVAIIIIHAYLTMEIAWQRNCLKVYDYLSALRRGSGGQIAKFDSFSKIHNPPRVFLSYLQIKDTDNYIDVSHRILQFLALLGNFKLVNSLDFLGFISGTYCSPHEGNIRIYKDSYHGTIRALHIRNKERAPGSKETSVSLLSVHQAMHTNFKIPALFTRYHKYLVNTYHLVFMVSTLALEAVTDSGQAAVRNKFKAAEKTYYVDSSDEDDFIEKTNPRILRTLKKKTVYTPESKPLIRNEKPVMTYSGKLPRSDQCYYIFKEVKGYCVEREPLVGFSLPLNGLSIDLYIELVAIFRRSKDMSVLMYYIIRAFILMALGFNPVLGLRDLSQVKVRKLYLSETTSGIEVWSLIDPALVTKHLGRKSIRDFFLPEPVDILLVLHSNLLGGRLNLLDTICTLGHKFTAVFSSDELRFITAIVSCYYELSFLLCESELLWLLSRNFSILLLNNTGQDLTLAMQGQFNIFPSITDQIIRKQVMKDVPLDNTGSFATISLASHYLNNLERSVELLFSSVAQPLLRQFSIINTPIKMSSLMDPQGSASETPRAGHKDLAPDTLLSFRGDLIFACTIGYSICIQNVRQGMLPYTLKFPTYVEHVWHFCYLRMSIYTNFAISLHRLYQLLSSPAFQAKCRNVNSVVKEPAPPDKPRVLPTIQEHVTSKTGSFDLSGPPIPTHPKSLQKDVSAEPNVPRSLVGNFSSRMTDISRVSKVLTKLNDESFVLQIGEIIDTVDRLVNDVTDVIRNVVLDSVITISSLAFKHQLIPTLHYDNALEDIITEATIDAGLSSQMAGSKRSKPVKSSSSYWATTDSGSANRGTNSGSLTPHKGKEAGPKWPDSRSFLSHLLLELKTADLRPSLVFAMDTFQIDLSLILRYTDLALEMHFGIPASVAESMPFLHAAHRAIFYSDTVHAFLCYILFIRVQAKFPLLSYALFAPILYMAETAHHIYETKLLAHPESADQIKRAYKFEFLDCSLPYDEFIARIRVIFSSSSVSSHPLCLYNMFSVVSTETNRSLVRLLCALFVLLNSPLPEKDEFGALRSFVASLQIDDVTRVSLNYHPRTRRMYMALADPYEPHYLLEFSHRIYILASPVGNMQYYRGTKKLGDICPSDQHLSAKESALVTRVQKYRQTVFYRYIEETLTIIFMHEAVHANLPLSRIASALSSKAHIIEGFDEFGAYIKELSHSTAGLSMTNIEIILTYSKRMSSDIKRLSEFIVITPSIKQAIAKNARTMLAIYELIWQLSKQFEPLTIVFTDMFFSSTVDAVLSDLQGMDHYALYRRASVPKSKSDKRMVELLPSLMHHLLKKISVLLPQEYVQPILGLISCLGFLCDRDENHINFLAHILKNSTPSSVSEGSEAQQRQGHLNISSSAYLFNDRKAKLQKLMSLAPDFVHEWITFFEIYRTQFLKYVHGPSFFLAVIGYYAYIERAPAKLKKTNAAMFLTRSDVYKRMVYEYSLAEAFGGFSIESGNVPAWRHNSDRHCYGSGTVPIKGALANTKPGDYNAYKIQDNREEVTNDSSSEESVNNDTEEDYDIIFDYDYSESEIVTTTSGNKTSASKVKQSRFSNRSMAVALTKNKIKATRMIFSSQGADDSSDSSDAFANTGDQLQKPDNTQSEKLIPDELLPELTEHMVVGTYPASIQTLSQRGIWCAFLLSICLNPEHLMQDLKLLVRVSKLTSRFSCYQANLQRAQADDELLSKTLQCAPGSLDSTLCRFIAAFYKSQLQECADTDADMLTYGLFFDENGEPFSYKAKKAVIDDSRQSSASKTVLVLYNHNMDVLSVVSFAFNYLIEPMLLTAPIIFKADPSCDDLLSNIVVAPSTGNASILWLLQVFMNRPVKPKHGLIVLIPTTNSDTPLSTLMLNHFCTAFSPEIVVFSAPTDLHSQFRHNFTLLRIMQTRFLSHPPASAQRSLIINQRRLPVMGDHLFMGLLFFLVFQNHEFQPSALTADTYTRSDVLAMSLLDIFLETEYVQGMLTTLRTRLRVHPATIENIQRLYTAVNITVSNVRRYDAARADNHPLNPLLHELTDQILIIYAREFVKLPHFSVHSKFDVAPGSLRYAQFLRNCIFAFCHGQQKHQLALVHNIVAIASKGVGPPEVSASELCEVGETSEEEEVMNESTALDEVSIPGEDTQKTSTIIEGESKQRLSKIGSTLSIRMDETSCTKQEQDIGHNSRRLGADRADHSAHKVHGSNTLSAGEPTTPAQATKTKNQLLQQYDNNSSDRWALNDPSRELRVIAPPTELQNLCATLVPDDDKFWITQRDSTGAQAMVLINQAMEDARQLIRNISGNELFQTHNTGQTINLLDEGNAGDASLFIQLCNEYLYSLNLYSSQTELDVSQISSLIANEGPDSCVAPQGGASDQGPSDEITVPPTVATDLFIGSREIISRLTIVPEQFIAALEQTKLDSECLITSALLSNAINLAQSAQTTQALMSAISTRGGILICNAKACWSVLAFILTVRRHHYASCYHVPYAQTCVILLAHLPKPGVSYVMHNETLYQECVSQNTLSQSEGHQGAVPTDCVQIDSVRLQNIAYDAFNQCAADCSLDSWPVTRQLSVYAFPIVRQQLDVRHLMQARSTSPHFIAVRVTFAPGVFLYLENKSKLSTAELAQRDMHLLPA